MKWVIWTENKNKQSMQLHKANVIALFLHNVIKMKNIEIFIFWQ